MAQTTTKSLETRQMTSNAWLLDEYNEVRSKIVPSTSPVSGPRCLLYVDTVHNTATWTNEIGHKFLPAVHVLDEHLEAATIQRVAYDAAGIVLCLFT